MQGILRFIVKATVACPIEMDYEHINCISYNNRMLILKNQIMIIIRYYLPVCVSVCVYMS